MHTYHFYVGSTPTFHAHDDRHAVYVAVARMLSPELTYRGFELIQGVWNNEPEPTLRITLDATDDQAINVAYYLAGITDNTSVLITRERTQRDDTAMRSKLHYTAARIPAIDSDAAYTIDHAGAWMFTPRPDGDTIAIIVNTDPFETTTV